MSKVELAGLDGLIERLRRTYSITVNRTVNTISAGPMPCTVEARPVVPHNPDGPEAAAKLEALRDCARDLVGFASHGHFCDRRKHTLATLIAPCTCGLDEALARFREVGEG